MKKFFLALSFVLILALSAFAADEIDIKIEENRAYFPPVIMYHDIKTEAHDKFDVLLDDFCAQLDWLKENGYQTLSMEEFVLFIKKAKPFPEKSVLLTFDDGYSGVSNYAVEELKKREMKATFFIITEMLGVFSTRYAHVMDRQLKHIAKNNLFSIGSHSLTHPHLLELDEDDLEDEIEDSKEILEKLTGRKILAFAYPYAEYNAKIIDEVIDAGYEAAFAVQDGELYGYPARYTIPRIYMGLDLCKNNQELFKKYIQDYKNMPPEAFEERFEPLPVDAHWFEKK